MPFLPRPDRRSGRGVLQAARPWFVAWLGGLVGTAVMTLALEAETKLRSNADGPIDYDASEHVVIAACALLRRPVPRSPAGRRKIANIVHWSYGSAVALNYEGARRRMRTEPAAAVLFYVGCEAMALTLFPTLGQTPPPRRWKRELLVSSLGVHALYAITVAVVTRGGRARNLLLA